MSALLEVGSLAVSLQREGAPARRLLRDVSFSLGEGEALGLVGESGSGKSMTARAIARLLPARARASGTVSFDGASVLDLEGDALRAYRARDVAMIFQDPRAHANPVRRIGDFLTEALRVNDRMSRAAATRRAVGLLEQVGIPDGDRRLRQYPHELSGGLLQRVMIAAVVAVRPRLILADEPTTALDVSVQSEVMAVLGEMQREHGMALLFISHDLELAAAVCDRTAVMYAGSIVEAQSSALMHGRPLHPYTAAMIRARPSIATVARRLRAIAGHPLAPYEAPHGCAFAARCEYVQQPCIDEAQPLRTVADGRSRCRRVEEILGDLATSTQGMPSR